MTIMVIIFFPQIRAFYEIMWKNVLQPDRPQITVKYGSENLPLACCLAKAADTHP
jgi:hypothetical protein